MRTKKAAGLAVQVRHIRPEIQARQSAKHSVRKQICCHPPSKSRSDANFRRNVKSLTQSLFSVFVLRATIRKSVAFLEKAGYNLLGLFRMRGLLRQADETEY